MAKYKVADIKVLPDRIVVINNAGIERTKLWFDDWEFARGEEQFKVLQKIGRELYDGEIIFADSVKSNAKKIYVYLKERYGHSRKGSKRNRERFAREFAYKMAR